MWNVDTSVLFAFPPSIYLFHLPPPQQSRLCFFFTLCLYVFAYYNLIIRIEAVLLIESPSTTPIFGVFTHLLAVNFIVRVQELKWTNAVVKMNKKSSMYQLIIYWCNVKTLIIAVLTLNNSKLTVRSCNEKHLVINKSIFLKYLWFLKVKKTCLP